MLLAQQSYGIAFNTISLCMPTMVYSESPSSHKQLHCHRTSLHSNQHQIEFFLRGRIFLGDNLFLTLYSSGFWNHIFLLSSSFPLEASPLEGNGSLDFMLPCFRSQKTRCWWLRCRPLPRFFFLCAVFSFLSSFPSGGNGNTDKQKFQLVVRSNARTRLVGNYPWR